MILSLTETVSTLLESLTPTRLLFTLVTRDHEGRLEAVDPLPYPGCHELLFVPIVDPLPGQINMPLVALCVGREHSLSTDVPLGSLALFDGGAYSDPAQYAGFVAESTTPYLLYPGGIRDLNRGLNRAVAVDGVKMWQLQHAALSLCRALLTLRSMPAAPYNQREMLELERLLAEAAPLYHLYPDDKTIVRAFQLIALCKKMTDKRERHNPMRNVLRLIHAIRKFVAKQERLANREPELSRVAIEVNEFVQLVELEVAELQMLIRNWQSAPWIESNHIYRTSHATRRANGIDAISKAVARLESLVILPYLPWCKAAGGCLNEAAIELNKRDANLGWVSILFKSAESCLTCALWRTSLEPLRALLGTALDPRVGDGTFNDHQMKEILRRWLEMSAWVVPMGKSGGCPTSYLYQMANLWQESGMSGLLTDGTDWLTSENGARWQAAKEALDKFCALFDGQPIPTVADLRATYDAR